MRGEGVRWNFNTEGGVIVSHQLKLCNGEVTVGEKVSSTVEIQFLKRYMFVMLVTTIR